MADDGLFFHANARNAETDIVPPAPGSADITAMSVLAALAGMQAGPTLA
jgi:hypothetical protein